MVPISFPAGRGRLRTFKSGVSVEAIGPSGDVFILGGPGPTTWMARSDRQDVKLLGEFGANFTQIAFAADGSSIRAGDEASESARWFSSADAQELAQAPETAVRGWRLVRSFGWVEERFHSRCVAESRVVELKQNLDYLRVRTNDGPVRPILDWSGFDIGVGTRCFFGRATAFTSDCQTLLLEMKGAVWIADVDSGRIEKMMSGRLVAVVPASRAKNSSTAASVPLTSDAAP